MLSDRIAGRRYQIRMTAAMVVVLVLAIPLAAILVKAMGSRPRQKAEKHYSAFSDGSRPFGGTEATSRARSRMSWNTIVVGPSSAAAGVTPPA